MSKLTSADLEAKLPFGKFHSKTLEEVPTNYLNFLQTQDWFLEKYTELSNAVERVLEDRQRWHE